MLELSYGVKLILFLLFIQITAEDISLSRVTLRLPTAGAQYKVKYLLESTGGCLTWEVANPSVIKLEKPQEDRCSGSLARSMWVVSNWNEQIKKSSNVKVYVPTDKDNMAECLVFIDKIESLEIETTTKVVYIGEVEALSVVAKDKEGNVFSSVSGLPFQWETHRPELQVLTLQEAKLSFDEFSTFKISPTDISPVCGKTTGSAVVKVSLGEIEASNKAITAQTTLSVIVKLEMEPVRMIMWPQCKKTIDLISVESNSHCQRKSIAKERTLITMPHNKYQWLSSDVTAASVDRNRGEVLAKEFGKNCEISITSTSSQVLDAVSSSVLVREPKTVFMKLIKIDPENDLDVYQTSSDEKWYVTKASKYRVEVALIDKFGEKFVVCSNLKYTPSIGDEDLAEVEKISEEKEDSILSLYAKKTGSTSLKVNFQFKNNTLEGTQIIQIVDPIVATPGKIILPFTGQKNDHSVELTITGGSGEYGFEITDENMVSVRQRTVYGGSKKGTTWVHVFDKKEPSNRAPVEVHIIRITELTYLYGPREVQVGNTITLHLNVKGTKKQAFTNSKTLQPYLNVKSEPKEGLSVPDIKWHQRDSIHGDFSLTFEANKQGFKDVISSITTRKYQDPTVSCKIQAFDPLEVRPNHVFMAVRSRVELTWIGGPQPWPNTDQSTKLKSQTRDVSIEKIKNNAFKVQCSHLHTQDLTLEVVNAYSSENQSPEKATASAFINCLPPLILEKQIDLGVGQHYQLKLPDWLDKNEELRKMLRFKVENDDISRVNTDKLELIGRTTGQTNVIAWIDHISLKNVPDSQNFLKTTIGVTVEFRGFVIVTPSNEESSQILNTGDDVLVYIEGSNSEAPGSESFSQVKITWSMDSSSTATAMLPVVGQKRDNSYLSYSSLRIRGIHKGSAVLQANIDVTGPNGKKHFKETLNIQVVDPWPSCSTILLPPRGQIDIMDEFQLRGVTGISAQAKTIDLQNNRLLLAGDVTGVNEVVQISDQEANKVLFLTATIEQPKGVIFALPNEKVCVGQSLNIKVSIYDRNGQYFSSLKGWAQNESLMDKFSVSTNHNDIVAIRKLNVDSTSDKNVVANLLITGIEQGEALLKLGVQGVKPMYVTVPVHKELDCQITHLRIIFSLTSSSPYYSTCSEFASRLLKFELAKVLDGLDTDKIIIEKLNLDDGIVAVIIESKEDDLLTSKLTSGYARLAANLGLSSQPEFEWIQDPQLPTDIINICPSKTEDVTNIQNTNMRGPTREKNGPNDYNLYVWKFLIILGCMFGLKFIIQVLTDIWEKNKKHSLAERRNHFGPNADNSGLNSYHEPQNTSFSFS